MPSPTPELIEALVARVGEPAALRWLGEWSMALLEGRQPPRMPGGGVNKSPPPPPLNGGSKKCHLALKSKGESPIPCKHESP